MQLEIVILHWDLIIRLQHNAKNKSNVTIQTSFDVATEGLMNFAKRTLQESLVKDIQDLNKIFLSCTTSYGCDLLDLIHFVQRGTQNDYSFFPLLSVFCWGILPRSRTFQLFLVQCVVLCARCSLVFPVFDIPEGSILVPVL